MAAKVKATGARASKPRAERAPAAKHVTIAPEQRLFVHVKKGEKQIAEYIAGADKAGVVRMVEAPEAPAPVATPNPVSGT
jgi:hypothetical protein